MGKAIAGSLKEFFVRAQSNKRLFLAIEFSFIYGACLPPIKDRTLSH